MTVQDLIDELTEIKRQYGPNGEVRITISGSILSSPIKSVKADISADMIVIDIDHVFGGKNYGTP